MSQQETTTEGLQRLSRRMEQMSESKTIRMARMSRELKAQGHDIISLSLGEPDFNAPDPVKQAAHEAIDQNYSHYPPVGGFGDLRQAICHKLERDNQLSYKPQQVVVSTGAKQSLANIFLSLLDTGDELLTAAPYWVSYPEMTKLTGAAFRVMDTRIEEDFKIRPEQLEAALNERTRIFLLCAPSNPTGTVYSREELRELTAVLQRHPEVLIVSDEIYEYIQFEGRHASLAQFPGLFERTVIVNGLSKSFAMTGWRLGYIAAPQWIAQACEKLQGQFTSGANAVAQRAAIAALEGGSALAATMLQAFEKRRNLLVQGLSAIPGMQVNKPQGAFYLFPKVSAFFGRQTRHQTTIEDAEALCMYLLEDAGVSTVPGDAFGAPEYIRLSYATHEQQLEQAIARITRSLQALR